LTTRSIPRAPRGFGTSIPPLLTEPFRGDTLGAYRTVSPHWYHILRDSCRRVHILVVQQMWPVMNDTVARSLIQDIIPPHLMQLPTLSIDHADSHILPVFLTLHVRQDPLFLVTC
jgi:hypothetical protein